MLFVDSNVILDVITADSLWQAWSEEQLGRWLDVMGSQLNRLEAVLP